MKPDERIRELNLILPEPIKLPSNVEMQFSWVRVSGNRAFVSGHIALNVDGSVSDVFGKDIGNHSRSAVGMAELPFGAPVEIEAEIEIAVNNFT